ncbi:DNA-3-methyladenine glycosylase I, partial [archaeon]|nr:DNA-3-methyladenine glycosylase I [archaeon]
GWADHPPRGGGLKKCLQGFNPSVVAEYTPEKVEELLQDPGIIRNRRKVESAVRNAGAFLRVQEEYGSFDEYVWGFVGGKPVMNTFTSWSEVQPETDVSKAMSKDLKKRGFNFVGPTICYAYMQSIGMVNDHLTSCFRWQEIVDEYGA